MAGLDKKVYGVGINDADYAVTRKKDGKIIWVCPYYKRWHSMFLRCYSTKHLKRRQTYIGCTVCDEWIYFMNFRAWMIERDWDGRHLDKDILIVGNKVYSPETCAFIHPTVNGFVNDHGRARGNLPLGVCLHRQSGKFLSICNGTFKGRSEHLGSFNTPEEAHLAWKRRKHELACQLADSEYVTDERVAEALRTRYL